MERGQDRRAQDRTQGERSHSKTGFQHHRRGSDAGMIVGDAFQARSHETTLAGDSGTTPIGALTEIADTQP